MIISEEINQRTKQPKRHVEQDLRPDRPLDEQLDGLHDEQLQRVLLRRPLRPSERQDPRFSCQTYIDVQIGKFNGSIN